MDLTPMTLEEQWQDRTVFRPDLLDGRVVLVSGGGSGLGRHMALLAARLGARVAICGRTGDKLDAVSTFAASRGTNVLAVPADIRDPEAVASLIARVHDELGGLDLLINNAGGQFPQPAIDFSPNGFAAVVKNNLHGTWFMMQAAARRWRDDGAPGSIVNIVAVVDRGMPGVAHTAAARAGVVALSKTVAVEWAPLHIRVNCVAPGVIVTEGMQVYPEEARARFPRSNPMLRPGRPMDVAEAALYLGTESGRFVTGEVLTIDGGGRLWGELWTAGRPDWFAE